MARLRCDVVSFLPASLLPREGSFRLESVCSPAAVEAFCFGTPETDF